MDKDKVLDEIFMNDPLGLLNIIPRKSNTHTEDERLIASFLEINEFITINKKEPEATSLANISEYQLYSRLKSLRSSYEKIVKLKPHDIYNLLPEVVEHNTIERQKKKKKKKQNHIVFFFFVF
ncbi:MAG: hypothetical protein KDK45_13590, partial [Leptospiraceae bacterium]|nr:hypothetical protein [Leptospiraceae bacterium]